MGGDGFELLATVGQRVTVGDPLVAFDLDKIVAAGCDPITVMVITNTAHYSKITQIGRNQLEPGDPVLELLAKQAQ
jgi:phosphotransferase system IIA component